MKKYCLLILSLFVLSCSHDKEPDPFAEINKRGLFSDEISIVRKVLDTDIAFDTVTNSKGYTPLMNACINDYTKIIHLLLDKGANPNNIGKDKYSPLLRAVANENIEIITMLLEKEADINFKSVDSITSLFYACERGKAEIVNILLKNKANANLTGHHNNTSILIAVSEGYFDIIKLLINNGAKLNIANEFGTLPIDVAPTIEIADYLLEKGAKFSKGGSFSVAYLYDQNKKYKKAYDLYLLAANAGNASAQNNLGVMYEKGQYVEKSKQKAKEWYKKAKNNGNELAAENYAILTRPKRNNSYSSSNSNSSTPSGSNILTIKVEARGFLVDREIGEYTVEIERTADLNGNNVYDYPDKKTHTSGFFGDDATWYDKKYGYYKVKYYGYDKSGKKVFGYTYSNVKHKCHSQITFYTDGSDPYTYCW